jgi:hypothetical protein
VERLIGFTAESVIGMRGMRSRLSRRRSLIRERLQRGRIATRSWLQFYDDALAAEWVGMWPETPPPPVAGVASRHALLRDADPAAGWNRQPRLDRWAPVSSRRHAHARRPAHGA